jgi:5-methylcytosine-specific restriction protein A
LFAETAKSITGLDFVPGFAMVAGVRVPSIRPLEPAEPNGFGLVFSSSRYRDVITLEPDHFAGSLVREMGKCLSLDALVVKQVLDRIEQNDAQVSFWINGTYVSSQNLFSTDNHWESFSFDIEMVRRDLSVREKIDDRRTVLVKFASSLLVCLLPIELVENFEQLGELEGKKMSVVKNTYERSPKNRAACLIFHGYNCFSCGLNFEQTYGSIGEKYIEVHHRVPVSLMGGEYRLDPKTDLVPLCSNCHSMVHTESPPITPENLKQLVTEARMKDLNGA